MNRSSSLRLASVVSLVVASATLAGAGSAHASPLSAVYRKVAPSTVLVRTDVGHGSGVVVESSSHRLFVLTNEHIVRDAGHQGARRFVSIEYGRLGEDGTMVREDVRLDGYVHQVDVGHDLALVEVKRLPAGMRPVRLATAAPTPGEPVACLGNPGLGMMFTFRPAHVSAIGRAGDLLVAQPAGLFDAKSLYLQTTCGITPGDSGGPLVNDSGELVGIHKATSSSASFHIHLSELTKLLASVAPAPSYDVPSPWFREEVQSRLADNTLDGVVDTLVMVGSEHKVGIFFDLAQSTFAGAAKFKNAGEMVRQRGFKFGFAYVKREGNAYVYYDTKSTGAYDLMLFDKGATGKVTEGFRIEGSGVRPDASFASTDTIQPKLIENAESAERLAELVKFAIDAK